MLKDDTELELYIEQEKIISFIRQQFVMKLSKQWLRNRYSYSLSSNKQMNVILWQDIVACFQHCNYLNCKSTLVAHRCNRQLLHSHHVWVISVWGMLGSEY